MVGRVPLGGGAPVSIQSMTNTDTRDVPATLAQIERSTRRLRHRARFGVRRGLRPGGEGAGGFKPRAAGADIHFDYRLAIAAVENGIAKVRINPGNIGHREKVQKLADCLKAHRVPVRVGVNAGSLERELLQKYGGPTAEALAESALSQARMLEDMGVGDIVLSLKASSVHTTVSACRLAAAACDYPLHLGVTEAGTRRRARQVRRGIGSLLPGLGDTIRVSLSGPPENEIPVCLDILRAVGARDGGVEVISCPTCGRTMSTWPASPTGAPGDAGREGAAQGGGDGLRGQRPRRGEGGRHRHRRRRDGGALFAKGKPARKVTGDLAEALLAEIRRHLDERPEKKIERDSIQMNELWRNIFKDVDPALVGCLTLDRVLVSRAGDKLVARFFASRVLEDREFSVLARALRAAFPGAKAYFRVSYPALKEDVLGNIAAYAPFICGLITRELPSAMPFLQWEEASWKMRGDLLIAEVDRLGVDYLAAQGVDRRVEALLKELFGAQVRVTLEPRGDEAARLQEIARKRGEEQALMAEMARKACAADAGGASCKALTRQLLGRTIAEDRAHLGAWRRRRPRDGARRGSEI